MIPADSAIHRMTKAQLADFLLANGMIYPSDQPGLMRWSKDELLASALEIAANQRALVARQEAARA